MRRRPYEVRRYKDRIRIVRRDSGAVLLEFPFADIPSALREEILGYGLAQIIMDGGALGASRPEEDRLAAWQRRADTVRRGTWGMRERALRDPDIFHAAVAAKRLEDSPAARRRWNSLTPRERDAVALLPNIAAFLAEGACASEEEDDILSVFESRLV